MLLIFEKLFQIIDLIEFAAKALSPILSSELSETKFNSVSLFPPNAVSPIDLILLSSGQ
jgi:hypothetical protein